MILSIIFGFIKVLLFIFEAVGVFKLAKKENIKSAGLCFIPFLTPYYFGAVSDNLALKEDKKEKKRVWLLISFFAMVLFTAIFIIAGIFSANEVIANAKICIENDSKMTIDMFYSVIYAIVFYFISLFASIIYKILKLITFGKVISKQTEKNATLYTVLSAVIYPLMPIFIFFNS